jgi:hypothetical protein
MVATLAVGVATGGLAVAHADKPSASVTNTTTAKTFLMDLTTIQPRYPSTES